MNDVNGHGITVGTRVYIKPRPSRLAPGSEISGRGGEVKRLLEDHPTHGQLIEVLTFPDGGVRTVKAAEVAVQYGKSHAHEEFTLQRKACPGPSRRGR